jgi:hypothetical protein
MSTTYAAYSSFSSHPDIITISSQAHQSKQTIAADGNPILTYSKKPSAREFKLGIN